MIHNNIWGALGVVILDKKGIHKQVSPAQPIHLDGLAIQKLKIRAIDKWFDHHKKTDRYYRILKSKTNKAAVPMDLKILENHPL